MNIPRPAERTELPLFVNDAEGQWELIPGLRCRRCDSLVYRNHQIGGLRCSNSACEWRIRGKKELGN